MDISDIDSSSIGCGDGQFIKAIYIGDNTRKPLKQTSDGGNGRVMGE